MPDLPNRTAREKELAAALLLVFQDGQSSKSVSASAVASAVREPLRQAHIDAGRNLIASLADAPPVPDDTRDAEADRWVAAYAVVLGQEIAASTRDLMANADDIDAVFGRKRAEMIAATEVTRAISAVEAWLILFWASEGFRVKEQVWHTEQDGLVCPVCRPLDGKPKAVWADFVSAGPPAHPNCRCWLDYQIR